MTCNFFKKIRMVNLLSYMQLAYTEGHFLISPSYITYIFSILLHRYLSTGTITLTEMLNKCSYPSPPLLLMFASHSNQNSKLSCSLCNCNLDPKCYLCLKRYKFYVATGQDNIWLFIYLCLGSILGNKQTHLNFLVVLWDTVSYSILFYMPGNNDTNPCLFPVSSGKE